MCVYIYIYTYQILYIHTFTYYNYLCMYVYIYIYTYIYKHTTTIALSSPRSRRAARRRAGAPGRQPSRRAAGTSPNNIRITGSNIVA